MVLYTGCFGWCLAEAEESEISTNLQAVWSSYPAAAKSTVSRHEKTLR